MYLAAIWMTLSCVLFALMGHFVKVASSFHGQFELMFFRSLGSLILISILLYSRKINPKTEHFKSHLARSLFGLTAMMSYFYSLTHLPVPTAITLNYTSPLFLGIASLWLLKEKSKPLTLLALILGFTGILILMKPDFNGHQLGSIAIGLCSGAMAAMAYTHIKELGRFKEPALRIVFYFSLISAIGSMILTLIFQQFHPITQQMLPYLIGIGLTGGLAQWLITKAYSTGNTLAMGAMGFSTIVFSSLINSYFAHDTLAWTDYAAQAFIIFSGLVSVWAEAKSSVQKS